jgi:hypothetical protein
MWLVVAVSEKFNWEYRRLMVCRAAVMWGVQWAAVVTGIVRSKEGISVAC